MKYLRDNKGTERPIFVYNNGLAFMENGGRYVILLPNGQFIDFGSGKGSHEPRPKTSFRHDVLGNITAEGSVFIFHDHNASIDFDMLQNSHFLNKRVIKHPKTGHYMLDHMYQLYHLYRFMKKHHGKNKE